MHMASPDKHSVSNNMICNYADDGTIHVNDYKNEEIIRKLENGYFIQLVSR